MATRQEVAQLVTRFWGHVGANEFDQAGELISDDVIWEVRHLADLLPHGNVTRGKKTVVEELLPFTAQVYDMATLKFTIDRLFIDGDTAIMEFTVDGTTSRGRPYRDVQYISVFTTAGGKIVEVREYVDGLTAKAAHFD